MDMRTVSCKGKMPGAKEKIHGALESAKPFGPSSAGGEGDNFDFGTIFHRDTGVVARENRLFVEFDDDRFAGEAEGFQQVLQSDGACDGMRRSVESDGGLSVHFHCRSCSGNGQS